MNVVSEPDPGTNGTLTLCASDATASLFSNLGGTPDIGGTWSAPNGAAFTGTFDPATDAPGIYTYTIAVPPPCTSVSSTVTVAVVQPPVAGNDGALTLCITSPTAALFNSLGGAPQAGGTWTAPNGSAFAGSFTPGTHPTGTYTYTVPGTIPCPADQATVQVNVVSEPDPGGDGFIQLCSTDGSEALFASLEGSPDQGGVWTGPTGGAFSGNFDPATDAPGVYTYTIAVPPPCASVSSTVTVEVVLPPDAGGSSASVVCVSGEVVDLFSSLTGTPDANGTWMNPSAQVHGGLFQPGNDEPGTYTYTVPGTTPCPADVATVSISVVSEVNAGTPGILNLCSSGVPASLFPTLGGADANGTWTGPNGVAFSGNFDPGTDLPGIYTYTVQATPPCADASATVTVNVLTDADAGDDNATTRCGDESGFPLFTVLGGSPDAGGIWIGPGGQPSNGTFDPSTDVPGPYTYVVVMPAPCVNDSATVWVEVTEPVNAGTDATVLACSNDASFALFPALSGAPDTGGTWSGPAGPMDGTFIPGNSPAGAYTYTVNAEEPCPDRSATITVQVSTPPNAGIDGAIVRCTVDDAVELFDALGGTPDLGGIWYAPDGTVFPGTFNPAMDVAGSYTYSVEVPPPCVSASATVVVNTVTPPSAGQDGGILLCASQGPTPLFPVLGSTAQPGGAWTDPQGGPFSGLFDPAIHVPGNYVYTVPGIAPCPDDDAGVHVAVEPLPNAGTDGSANLCPEAPPLDLFGLLGGDPQTTGYWTSPDGSPSNGVFVPGVSVQGSYTYTVPAQSVCPDQNSTASVTIFLVTPPDAGPDVVSCTLQQDLSASGNWASGSWSGPSGISFSNPDAAVTTVQAATGGTYLLVWSVMTTDGCSAQDSITVVLTDAINVEITTTDAVCNGACNGAAEAAATGGNVGAAGHTFSWSAGNGAGDSVSGLCAGAYVLTVADMNGCALSTPFTIGEPAPLVIDAVTATPVVCVGDCNGMITVSDPEGALYSLNGGTPQAASSFAGLCPGTYAITMWNSDGCQANSTAVVGPATPVIANFELTPETLYVSAPEATFTSTSSPNAVSFSWDFAGLGTSTAEGPSFTFPGTLGDSYVVCLTVADVNGCTDTYCSRINVLDRLGVWVPNAFTPNEDGINDTFFPVFNLPNATDYEFLIFDRWGEQIFTSTVPGEGWDGSVKGILSQNEVYVWKLIYRDPLDVERKEVVGHVTLVR